ncbi:MAG: hypothetical protein DLM59_00035 [Pseudonocardiales bacterium]|nr:MAG: hypothetical protein DLM59_00035 [Pseudonocardiales bacterium]
MLQAAAGSLGADGPVPTAAMGELETCREELRVAEEELRTQHEELMSVLERQSMPAVNSHLLDDLPVAALVSDRLGVLTRVNRPAAQLLGDPPHALVGKPLISYVEGDRRPFRQLLGQLAGGDHRARLRVELRARSGAVAPGVLIARRDGDGVTWVVVPDEATQAAAPLAPADAEAWESAHMAVAGLALLPITTSALPDLLADVEKLAATAVPGAGRVTIVLDADGREASAGDGEAGVAAVFILHAQEGRIGTMRVEPDGSEPLDAAAERTAELFAAAAAAVVGNARALLQSRELVQNLSQALEHRSVIEQAKGMLMVVRHCDEDAAFDQLRIASQQTNTKLHEVARRLVITMSRESAGRAG